MQVTSRAGPNAVALESTLLIHGVPKHAARQLAADLSETIRANGAEPALVALVAGVPTVGLTDSELDDLLAAPHVPKVNTANLGLLLHARAHAATSVSATMELAAAAGLRLFATGGLGGVHRGFGARLDISADLAAFTRFPVAVVCSGVKSLLDVESTREALETLGVPVIGWQTDRFPAFYLRESPAKVDARFDDAHSLASFIANELARTSRGIVIANPIPPADEIPPNDLDRWLAEATTKAAGVSGRDATPHILAELHALSRGRTLRANLALAKSNAALAAQLAARLPPLHQPRPPAH